jgi:dipeptidyl aminopeptidase/acylaminoacyl peptidase
MIFLTRRNLLGSTGAALAALSAATLAPRRAAAAEAPPLPPRHLFFEYPDHAQPRLSPDGKHLAWLAPRGGTLNLMVAPLDELARARPLTKLTSRPIRFYTWAFTNQHLVFFHDEAGEENYRPFSVALDGGEPTPLLPAGARSFVQQRARLNPNNMLFGHNGRDPAYFDLIRINVTTGDAHPLFQNPGFSDLWTAADFTVRFGQRYRHDGSTEVMAWEPNGAWRRFLDIPAEDALTTWLDGISSDGRSAFVIDSRGRDKAALIEIDIATREYALLAEDPDADICAVVYERGSSRPLAAIAVGERQRWHVVEPGWTFDVTHLRKAQEDADAYLDSMSFDHDKLVIAYDRSDAAVEFRLFDRPKQTVTPLFKARNALDDVALRPMRPVSFPASDGVPIHGYLTLPADDFRDGPVVLLIHGGPYARDVWGYSGRHQFLASRGYGVLSVNYRGSTGYGKRFVALADQGWGGRMQDDLTDAAAWIVQQGIADPKRLGFWGQSYGGYAALAAATKTPETFACIIDFYGPSNLVTLLRNSPPYWAPWLPAWYYRLADPATEEGRAWLTERSPLTYAGRVTRPLLIAQGLRDVRVTPVESAQFVKALQEGGIPVTYLTFSDEGHGYDRQENRLAVSAVAEQFLAQHLGGRAEPVGGAFNGSTIAFQVGKDLIAGLA